MFPALYSNELLDNLIHYSSLCRDRHRHSQSVVTLLVHILVLESNAYDIFYFTGTRNRQHKSTEMADVIFTNGSTFFILILFVSLNK